jgi:hypothetical protein
MMFKVMRKSGSPGCSLHLTEAGAARQCEKNNEIDGPGVWVVVVA